jgi:hypothetical protein
VPAEHDTSGSGRNCLNRHYIGNVDGAQTEGSAVGNADDKAAGKRDCGDAMMPGAVAAHVNRRKGAVAKW